MHSNLGPPRNDALKIAVSPSRFDVACLGESLDFEGSLKAQGFEFQVVKSLGIYTVLKLGCFIESMMCLGLTLWYSRLHSY